MRQVPAPLQTREGVYVEPVHDSSAQVMPAAHARHAPAPSHWPSRPQVDVASCAQSLSGSVPFVTGRQRPSARPVLAFTHAEQLPVHAASQQTVSTHEPLAQSAAAVQGAPFAAPVGPSPASVVPPSPAVPPAPAALPPSRHPCPRLRPFRRRRPCPRLPPVPVDAACSGRCRRFRRCRRAGGSAGARSFPRARRSARAPPLRPCPPLRRCRRSAGAPPAGAAYAPPAPPLPPCRRRCRPFRLNRLSLPLDPPVPVGDAVVATCRQAEDGEHGGEGQNSNAS